ncbi:hypothetical protein IC229_08955 [Spirosoma sp. BT702]|uniref:Uncharacterized protein n=1 Tax=Spirosoma profusum TaxID=2771354 RepID=A0A926XV54_9BACT|nr:hypothetical protein [Spirosoma profusum]MBD2700764.1 hypothetical protein [Spirosoma profusum]
MAWKFGGIYLKHSFNGDPVLALNRLDVHKRFCYERARFSVTVSSTFEPTAIGLIDNVALMHDNVLPYDHSYDADTYYPADHRLMVLSREIENVVFYLDGITNSYGLAHFRNGERITHFSQLSGEVIVQEGDFAPDATSVETQLLTWLDTFTGLSFNKLMQDDEPIMALFTDTGF